MDLLIIYAFIVNFALRTVTCFNSHSIPTPVAKKIYGINDAILKSKWPWVKQPFSYDVQSPVNILTKNAVFLQLPTLTFYQYWDNEREMTILKNDGYTVKLSLIPDVEPNDRPMITGGPLQGLYLFDSMHLHWGKTNYNGSEHTLDGRTFSCEMHIVHYNAKYGSLENAEKYFDGVSVVSFFGKLSKENNHDLDEFMAELKLIQNFGDHIVVPVHKVFRFIRKTVADGNYYTYPGSLTTGDFNECVIWIVFTKTFDISAQQLDCLRSLKSEKGDKLIAGNDRKLQPFNNRPIIYAL